LFRARTPAYPGWRTLTDTAPAGGRAGPRVAAGRGVVAVGPGAEGNVADAVSGVVAVAVRSSPRLVPLDARCHMLRYIRSIDSTSNSV
jgi:hypothetical protein